VKSVPGAVVAIYFLLFMLFNSLRLASLIILVLLLTSIGGVVGLFVTGEYLSVPASVGFIALWGIAVLNGVVLVSCIRKLREEGLEVAAAVREGCVQRFRPVMMTATVALLGLVPFLFAQGPGSEVQWPLAVVVIGGLIPCCTVGLMSPLLQPDSDCRHEQSELPPFVLFLGGGGQGRKHGAGGPALGHGHTNHQRTGQGAGKILGASMKASSNS